MIPSTLKLTIRLVERWGYKEAETAMNYLSLWSSYYPAPFPITTQHIHCTIPWVGVKNFGFTEEQKNIEQGSIKLKELHVCIMRVQKKKAAWRSEVP